MKFQILNSIVLVTILILLGGMAKYDWPGVYILFPLILWAIVVPPGSFNIQWNFFLNAISKGNPAGNKIALTFDDGPHPEYTPRVLELLEKYDAKASFFCIGKKVKKHPAVLQEIHLKGHNIGNHSFSHGYWIDFNGKNSWLREIDFTDREIEKVIGRKPRFFRPPFGVTTPHLAKAIRKRHHRVIGWNLRSFDTVKNPNLVVDKILKNVSPGSILLLHDHLPGILTILEQLLPELLARNFTFVTLEELIDSDHEAHQV